MEHVDYLNNVLVFLLAAVVVVSVFRWIRFSPIIGYLLAGILIGPYGIGFLNDNQGTKFLGEFGVVFLLFSIGLKLPLQHLQSMRRYVFGIGFLQVMVTSIIISALSSLAGLEIEAAILIGCGLALSSTAVGVQILSEREEFAARFGRVTFAVLLFQDLAVVVFLVLLTTLGQQEVSLLNELGIAIFKAGVVLVIIILVGRVFLRPVYRAISILGNPELFVAMTLLVVLTTSVTTSFAGLPKELGAFLAGLLLSETEYRHQIEADIQPFHSLLLGLFFMTVGMGVNLGLLWKYIMILPGLLLSLLLIKISVVVIICRLFSLSWTSALRAAFLLTSGGEFAFVMFAQALNRGFISEEISNVLFTVVTLSMGLVPLFSLAGKYIEDFYTEKEGDAALDSAVKEIGDLRNHVIITGFGRVGQLVARLLSERMIPYVAIDTDLNRVNEARARGLPVFYGDARRPRILRTIGIKKAKVVVISINKTSTSLRAATLIRRNFPDIDICIRMHDDTHLEKLKKLKISVVMPENLEPSLQLIESTLHSLGISDEETTQIIDGFRRALTTTKPSSSPSSPPEPQLELE